MQNTATTDRYISFNGIACDDHAQHIVSALRIHIDNPACPAPWQTYFVTKLEETARRGQDELYFVGSQVNAIRELFIHYNDTGALQLLEQVEEECC
ncbi:N(2)-fixation sustaining protein CowN [Chromatium okenii]|uniref:N(2)-fixation sustaining protein CowN n=1 Tax=Chromatium okenii TaxID=61644 RepID=A0A2S7XND0_9GAMM|nr:N(2)-fixation sustaining protein CowN [Chromatium okenii]MBV5311269.1 N(2)-fixation sustaining protein CowN [Chromatium okenii]PQJ95166.1 N(2)-fixation sustaining protein CowN [Chromatium okenii]PQJ97650.1 N(2)-fixation sustaining protein CowN [Chromatium okenii]